MQGRWWSKLDKKSAICRYLYKYHRGKSKAIYSKEIESIFCIGGRSLRRIISLLRQDGYPICSDETGYYYAKTQKEINETVGRLSGLSHKISVARNGMLSAKIKNPSK